MDDKNEYPITSRFKRPCLDLFGKVIKCINIRPFQQELARNGLKRINRYQTLLKLVLLALYFELDLSDAYSDVKKQC